MNETVNQVNENTEAKQEEATPKTFTQAEVDAIVRERLARDRAKYADYETLKEKAERADSLGEELATIKRANEIRDMREKVAREKGIPVNLLTSDTEEECVAQADGILAFAKPATYPSVKDGGEVTVTSKRTVRDQFADWFDQIQK